MKQVLLAINGDHPTTVVFNYAVDLCTRIRAELNILQFVKQKKLSEYLQSTKKRVSRIGKLLEDSFAGIAFAEEGMPTVAHEILSVASEPLKKMLLKNHKGIYFKIALTNGNPESDLGPYIENHHDIVLTIFDQSEDLSSPGHNRVRIDQINKRISVPLVVVTPTIQPGILS